MKTVPGRGGGATPTTGGTVTTWDTVRFMLVRLRPYRPRTALTVLIVGVRVVLGVVTPLAMLVLLDRALPQRDLDLLFLVCGGIFVAGGLGSALYVAETVLISRLSQRLVADLRVEIFARAHAQPLEFFAALSPSELQARLVSDVNGVDRFLSQTLRSALSAAAHAVAATVAMVLLSWPLALASLVLTAVLSQLNNRLARVRRRLATERQQHVTTMIRRVADALSLQGIVLGRTIGRTGHQLDEFTDVCESISDTTVRQRVVGSGALMFIGFCFAAFPPGIYLVSGVFLRELSVGAVVALVMLQMRLSDPLQTLLSFSAQIQASVATFERIIQYTSLDAEPLRPARKKLDGTVRVTASGVRYEYQGAVSPALADIEMDLAPGTMNVVLGPTGSGKSTLGLVLTGLVRPQSGTVKIDGGPADLETLRRRATLVPQDIGFLNGSLRENLRFAREGTTDAEMLEVLRVACLDGLLARLPQGLDTPVGEDGHMLSGGERQRLAISRALLAGGTLLILDEATSALDGTTAQLVHESLRSLCPGRTVLVICHRIPRLTAGDRVFILDRGRVVEQGTHRELRAAGGHYAALLAAQDVSHISEDHEEEEHEPRWSAAGSRGGPGIPLATAQPDS
ncbi:ABC transporter ATP-binding protein [Streptomyces sp. NPDC057429]|uniref:ABC transporter ATP-binding protein n=1 Tax=Streptomyces sp. NPDC057429 TaxID=3346130 RepID=UPI0036B9E4FD